MSRVSRSLCHEYIICRNVVIDDSAIIKKEEPLIVEYLRNKNSIRIKIYSFHRDVNHNCILFE